MTTVLPILQLENVCVEQQGERLLDHISFTVFPGTVVSVIGSNGAGKSTLMRVLVGSLSLTSGIVKNTARRIGYVPQFLHLDAHIPLTVGEFLRLFSDVSSLAQIEKVCRSLGTEGLLKKSVGSLSGGERRRMLLTCALLQDPELFLLDEPTAGMDLEGEKQFYTLLSELKHAGKTIILVSHDMSHVAHISDTIICLDKRILCQGSLEEIQHCGMFAQQHLTHVHHHH